MKLKEFDELIWDFIINNVTVSGCRQCHEQGVELCPDDYKGSYDKALKELFDEIIQDD